MARSPLFSREVFRAAAWAALGGALAAAVVSAALGEAIGLAAGAATGIVVARIASLRTGRGLAARIADVAAWMDRGRIEERPDTDSLPELDALAEAARDRWRRIERERREAAGERDRLAELIDELTQAVLIADADEIVRLANPAAERMLAASPLEGRRLVEVVRDHEILQAVAVARRGAEATTQVERADPWRIVRAVVRPLRGGELLLTMQDLSTVRRLETVRRDFVANVSHELRTPIASLKAMVETLEAGAIDDPAAARDFVARMHREIDGLAQLVAELLTLARVESGQEELGVTEVHPAELLEQVARRLGPLVARAGLVLEVSAAEGLPAVRVDGEKIGQVLGNLVHNAVKFTPAGGRIRLGAEDRGQVVAIHVADTGAGIARDDLERVFERFYKSDRARAGGGTGLGLAIAKHIVQAHGGEISASSEGIGRGATFTFTIPVAL
ncbi:MAG TPA: ATP-binding protein [Candidatus Limnocylindrales bacterium]|nr:ATP-binding protein [Candidatus Limnocylindrales bacterium]